LTKSVEHTFPTQISPDTVIIMKSALSHNEIEKLAARQLLDYQSNNPGTCFSELGFNIDLTTAYDLQDSVTRLRVAAGERVIGYKVGCTGPGTRAQFGMDGPIRGTLFKDEALINGACINPDEFCHLAIEGEMAIKIGEECQIEAAFPVIELHNFIFRAEQKTLSELIANNGINAGIVLPDIEWQQSAKHIHDEASLTLSINGYDIGNAGLWPNDAGPEASLIWLKNNLRDSGIELAPGDIVLAGTALGLYPVKDGDEVIVYIDSQPTVSCRIKK
jgi:2-keto-4-pentenoate hydratase